MKCLNAIGLTCKDPASKGKFCGTCAEWNELQSHGQQIYMVVHPEGWIPEGVINHNNENMFTMDAAKFVAKEHKMAMDLLVIEPVVRFPENWEG